MEPEARDDRVLRTTRWLAGFITPFLVAAFVILYGFPSRTAALWAWTIDSPMTSMVLASAYLGGAVFFVCVLRERRWAAVADGFLAVAAFATLLAIATVLHWDRFNHTHPAFWTWSFLYAAAPFLVVGAWLRNRRTARPPEPDEPRLPTSARVVAGVFGFGGLGFGAVMFVAPSLVIPLWPWSLTPLTARVMAAVLVLASATAGVAFDPRWVKVRLLLVTEIVMLVLMLLAAWRARDEMLPDRPLGWGLLTGAVLALLGSVVLWALGRTRSRTS